MTEKQVSKIVDRFMAKPWLIKFSFGSRWIRVEYAHYLDGLDLLKELKLDGWTVQAPAEQEEITQLELAVDIINENIRRKKFYTTVGACDELHRIQKILHEAIEQNDIYNIPF